MKKVYVVTHGKYDDETVEQIFSDEDLAQRFYEHKFKQDYNYNPPEEYDLIEKEDEWSVIIPQHTLKELYDIVGYQFEIKI